MTHSIYSTRRISEALLNEIKAELADLDYGSLEVYVANGEVTQITKRRIRKTVTTVKHPRQMA